MSDDLELMNKWRGRLDEWPGHAWKYVNYLANKKKVKQEEKLQQKTTRNCLHKHARNATRNLQRAMKTFLFLAYHL